MEEEEEERGGEGGREGAIHSEPVQGQSIRATRKRAQQQPKPHLRQHPRIPPSCELSPRTYDETES